MTGVSRQVDLRPGEQLRLWRRRLKLNRAQAAQNLRRSRSWVGEVERGEKEVEAGELPWYGSRDLAAHEKCCVYRLRTGRTQAAIAGELSVSRLWVNKMERGEVNCDTLLWYWEA